MNRFSKFKERWHFFKEEAICAIDYQIYICHMTKQERHTEYLEWCHDKALFPSKYNYFRFKIICFTWIVSLLPCLFIGHNYIDVGCSGPETGEIEFICKRCGQQGERHVLY